MNLIRKSGALSSTRAVSALLLAAFSLFVSGCGSSNDNTAAMAVAAQQQKIAATNTSIIQMSAGKMLFGTPEWGSVAGTAMLKTVFQTYSGASGKSQSQRVHRYSVDTGGRLTKQKMVFGTSSSATAFSYDGATTRVKEVNTGWDVTAYTYDSSGRISGYSRADGTPPTVYMTTTIVYDAAGRTETTSFTGTTTTFTYVYDTHNNEVSRTDGTTSIRSVNTYDASGNRLTEKNYYKASASATEVLTHESISTYGPSGFLTRSNKNYDLLSGALTVSSEETNTYGSNGKIAQTSVVTKDAAGNIYYSYNWSNTYITMVSGKDDQ
jgi:YD repeat-containing protein